MRVISCYHDLVSCKFFSFFHPSPLNQLPDNSNSYWNEPVKSHKSEEKKIVKEAVVLQPHAPEEWGLLESAQEGEDDAHDAVKHQ